MIYTLHGLICGVYNYKSAVCRRILYVHIRM